VNPIITVCLVALFVIPLVFVANRVYNDGVIGRLALFGISGAAGLALMGVARGYDYFYGPETTILIVSFTAFLIWHLFRFHRMVLSHKGNRDHERRSGCDRRFIGVPERRRQE
jgi:hypothetical protein